MDALELSPYGPIYNDPFISTHTADLASISSSKLSPTKQNRLFISAGITACITSSFYNPLDCLRVRWQTIPASSNVSSEGILYFARNIVQNEGIINGLWRPGVTANALGMGSSAALRFGFYESVRDALQELSVNDGKSTVGEEKKGIHMLLAGLSCGAGAYLVTSPFHLMKTMLQAEKNVVYVGMVPPQNGIISGFKSIVKEQGILGLWKGSTPIAARGALFTAGQMVGYDGFKTLCKSRELIDDGIELHIASSIVAAFGATILSTPADYVMARYVSSTSKVSLSQCIMGIYKESGILGFWRGSGICFIRVCPVILSYSTIYEQLRLHMGLGYLS
jgi:hypothetical protein